MKTRNGRELKAKYWGTRIIQYIYKGSKLVWTSISSCFGSGAWLNDKVWSDNDSWKN